MSRFSTTILAGAASLLLATQAHAALFTTTIDFSGGGIFDANGNLTLNDVENAIGNGFAWDNDSALRDQVTADLGSDAFALGIGVVFSNPVVDLPGVDEQATWVASFEINIDAQYSFGSTPLPFNDSFSGSANLNTLLSVPPFSINEAAAEFGAGPFADLSEVGLAIAGLLGSIDEYNLEFDATTAVLATDDLASGPGIFVVTNETDALVNTADFLGLDDVLPILSELVSADGTFNGTLTIEARTQDVQVSEPATLALLGLGLAGFSVARRRA